MFFFIERGRRHDGSPADRGVHIHGHHASLSLILSQGRGHGISYSRGWADVYVELRLGRLLLAVSWDYEREGPGQRQLNRLWTEQQEAESTVGATKGEEQHERTSS